MKVVFFGTSNAALPILEALHSHHELVLIITLPDSRVGKKQLLQESPVSALAKDLKLNVIKPEKVKGNEELLKTLNETGADIFIVVSYGKILPIELIYLPKFKTLNVHFSLLPKYRGAAPLQWSLMNGDTTTGTTIFILDAELDHGPILAQEEIAIENDDTFITLAERAAHKSSTLLLNTMEAYEAGKITPEEQDHAHATSTKLISKADGKIDWNKTAEEIFNQFRAYYPWPGIWTNWENLTLKILACHVFPYTEKEVKVPGTVDIDGTVWAGGGTRLFISELQLAGKNPTDLKSFLNGNKSFLGGQLG